MEICAKNGIIYLYYCGGGKMKELEEGKDYCTLVTCTPYGINSHRLLVRGHRVANQEDASSVRMVADAVQIEPVLAAPLFAAPILLVLLVLLFVSTHRKKEK